MLFQGRSNIINPDGSIEYGEWETNVIADNYVDCLNAEATVSGVMRGVAIVLFCCFVGAVLL